MLASILNALNTNPNVVIGCQKEEIFFPDKNYERLHGRIKVCVAPAGKELWTVDSLQKFMLSLVPEFKPDQVVDCVENEQMLSCGRLYFTEVLGEIASNHSFTSSDKAFPAGSTFNSSGTFETTVPIKYGLRIYVYPNPEIAKRAHRDFLDSLLFKRDFPILQQPSWMRTVKRVLAHV